jgi:hypothetical protein
MAATTTFPTVTQSRYFDGPAGVADRAPLPAHIAGEDLDAISMPATFGALVQAELGIMMLAGPVITDDDGSWTFLTERADTRRPVPTDLLRLGVRAVPAGTALVDAGAPGQAAAIWWTVIGAARRVAHRLSRVA